MDERPGNCRRRVLHWRTPMTTPSAVVDTLYGLLEAEQASPFRFATESSPYSGRAGPELKVALAYIAAADTRRASELWRLVERLGGSPRQRRLQPADQFLAYVSIHFLLPKLVEAKALLLNHYRYALADLVKHRSPASAAIKVYLSEHAAEMEVLRDAAESVPR